MTQHKLIVSTIGIGFVSASLLVGGAWAAQPTQADIDFCNQQAMARTTQGSPTSSDPARQPGQMGSGAVRGSDQPAAQGTPSTPGTVTSPGSSVSSGTGAGNAGGTAPGSRYPGHTGTGSSAESGGSASNRSTPSGSVQSVPGMAPIDDSNVAYRQAYLDCLQQRVK